MYLQVFRNATGPVLAPSLGMEVVTGFFLEAGFIGVMLYGDGRVKERTMLISTCIVALGTLLSTTWIISANSWMQTPSGSRSSTASSSRRTGVRSSSNPSFAWRYLHMLLAVLISTAWLIGGIAAYYLIKGRVQDSARRTLSLALGVWRPCCCGCNWISVIMSRDTWSSTNRRSCKPLKATGPRPAPATTSSPSPDMSQQKDTVLITIPKLGSVFGAKDLSGTPPLPACYSPRRLTDPICGPFSGASG
ncbi:MAG TPA: cytochrome ubiquinol oxidase subunit I [Pseudonocardiaceae bacterium]